MLPSVLHELTTGHLNDFIQFNYGLLLLFPTKCTANSGIETPGLEVYLTLAETPSENNLAFMQLLSILAY